MEYFQLSIDAFIDILSEMILCLIIKIPTPTQALSLLDHCSCFTAGSDLGCPWIGSDVKTILTQKWLITNKYKHIVVTKAQYIGTLLNCKLSLLWQIPINQDEGI